MGRDSVDQRLVSKALMLEHCHGIFFVGDIIYKRGIRNTNDPLFKSHFLDYYEELTKVGNRPNLYVVLGNHDHQGSVDAWPKHAQDRPFIFMPDLFWKTKLSNICIIGIDSVFQQYKRPPEWQQRQEDFMRKLSLSDCKRTIAIAHHFVQTSGRRKGKPVKAEWKKFYDTYISSKFDYFIAGHDHILSFEGDDRGTWNFISGAAGRPERGGDPGYLVLDVEDEKAHVVRARLKRIRWGKITEQVLPRVFEK